MKKKIPQFKNREEEDKFWQENDSADFINWSKSEKDVEMPNLKPSTKTISLRFSESMLNELKMIANKKDVPYQSFIKIIIDERLKNERQKMIGK